DGARLAFAAARHDDWDLTRAVDVFTVDAGGGEPARLTATDLAYSNPVWSADGTTIAVHVTDERTTPRHSQIALLDVDSGARRVLTEDLDRQCAPFGTVNRPVWDGGELWFAAEDGGNVHLYRYGSDDVEVVVGGDRWVTGYD